MKKLHSYMLKSFVGPFFATFFISEFVLLMQMMWRYIDDIVGKGLEISIILELLTYLSVTLVPMALPLAVLLSSIMTFGNLGENYELIALKSAGISLYRIMRPLIMVIIILTVGAFFFSNNILPIANMKAFNLLRDIRRHKPEMNFKEGVFTNALEGYSIKMDRINKETGMMYNMMIYNHRDLKTGNYEVTKADSGFLISIPNTSIIQLDLFSGTTYTDEGLKPENRISFPFRRLNFDRQTVLIDLPANDLKRSEEGFISSAMLSLDQLNYTIDSLQGMINEKIHTSTQKVLASDFQKGKSLKPATDSLYRRELAMLKADADSLFRAYEVEERQQALEHALRYARDAKVTVADNLSYEERYGEVVRKNQIEWHKKFTLSFACLIFFFVGAPLGGIIRKGGLGMPIVVSTLLFIIYYVVSMIGERSAKEGVFTVLFGSWLSSLVFLPLGVFLTYKSVTDSEMMSGEAYMNFFKKIGGFFKSVNTFFKSKKHART